MMPPNLPHWDSDGITPSPDEVWVGSWLRAATWRWRTWIALRSTAIGIGVALLVRSLVDRHAPAALPAALVLGTLVCLWSTLRAPGLRDSGPIARAAERDIPDLRNALVAWLETRGQLLPPIASRLTTHVRGALSTAPWPHPYSRGAWAAALTLLVAGGVASRPGRDRPGVSVAAPAASTTIAVPVGSLQWSVSVTPPAYARRGQSRLYQPARVDVLSGSRVDIAFANWPSGGTARIGRMVLPLVGGANNRMASLTASASDVMVVQDARQEVVGAITLVVQPDGAPTVRLTAPAADERRTTATGVVPITVTAQDDIGLRDLRLRFTKVAGSGESFTFEDGEWPVHVMRTSATQWAGAYRLDLAKAGLAPGDSVVYHAVAHDARVGAEGAAESERFIIEITRPGALGAGDFSLPEPEARFALSQRMVIQLTERLLERRGRMTAELFAQESQGLAIAQRRVRAEFVFMLGGQVEDEFDEAAHSHEVEEGRQANQGKGDLTEAVRQMSRAEAALTAVAVRDAVAYEYRALAALQAAFGKARYFMRTLPASVQIDSTRRLQGDRSSARSGRWAVTPLPDVTRVAALVLLDQLATPRTSLATLVPDLVALDRNDPAWVAAVQRAATDNDADGVARVLRARLLPGSPAWMRMPLARTAAEASLSSPASRRPR